MTKRSPTPAKKAPVKKAPAAAASAETNSTENVDEAKKEAEVDEVKTGSDAPRADTEKGSGDPSASGESSGTTEAGDQSEQAGAADPTGSDDDTAEELIEVRILRDQGEYRCNEVVELPESDARNAYNDGWGDPYPEAVAAARALTED